MLILEWKADTTVPVEADCIVPEKLAGKSADAVAGLPVLHGNRSEPLGEFFRVSGRADDGSVVLEGDLSRVKWIGAGMRRGRIQIRGHAGMHLGADMAGGRIDLYGNAGAWLGAEMTGGFIHVRGDADHQVGAAYRGSRRGMTGGTILVQGRAGNEVGARMRRGLIAVGGSVGDFAGFAMIAGSVLLFGPVGIRTAAGMKRGSIVLLDPTDSDCQPELLPTFRLDCLYRPTFLAFLLRQLAAMGFAVESPDRVGTYRRYSGDLLAGGKGEILVRMP